MSTTTNTTKKITKAQRNSDIIALLRGEEVKYHTTIEEAIAHLKHENELLARKNSTSGNKKLTKAQERNEVYKSLILTYFQSAPSQVLTATEVLEKILRPNYPDELWSSQKAAALLNAMSDKKDKDTQEVIAEGVLEKIEGKGKTKTTFTLKKRAEEEDEPEDYDEEEEEMGDEDEE